MTASSEAGGGGTVRRFRRHRWLAAAGLALALATLLAIGAAYAYARSQRDLVARGIYAGTIDLGGLSAGAARIKLERAYRPLERPLVLRYGGGQLVLTARQAKLSLDPRELVVRALGYSSGGLGGRLSSTGRFPHRAPCTSRATFTRCRG